MARDRIASLRLSADTTGLLSLSHESSEHAAALPHVTIDVTDMEPGTDERRALFRGILPGYTQLVDDQHNPMGRFMDQASMISAQIHLLQSRLQATSLGIEDVLERMPTLQAIGIQLDNLTKISRAQEECHESPLHSAERSIKREQLMGLNLRLSDLLISWRKLAKDDLENLRREVSLHLNTLEIPDDPDHVFALSLTSAKKRFSAAVRDSRRYPEARQAESEVVSRFGRLKQIEADLRECDLLAQQLLDQMNEGSQYDHSGCDGETKKLIKQDSDDLTPRSGRRLGGVPFSSPLFILPLLGLCLLVIALVLILRLA